MRRTLRGTVMSVIILCGLLLGGTAGTIRAAAPASGAHLKTLVPVTVVLKWLPQAQFAGYYVALKKGYYAEQGLDVHILPGGPDVVPEKAVEQGQAQFGTGWLPALLTERDHGKPLVNIAQIFQTTGMRLIAFNNEHINSPKDFTGKRIGVWFGGNQYQFLAWMNKLNYNVNSAFTVVHQGFDMAAFLQHRLDLASAMTYNELGLVLESGVKLSDLKVYDYGQQGVSMLEDGIFARSDYLATHRDIAVSFLRASIHGWQDVVTDPTQAGQIVKSYDTSGQMSLKHQVYMATEVAKLIEYGPAEVNGIGYMDPSAFLRTARLSLQYHVIGKLPTSGAYDQSFWREATFGATPLAVNAAAPGNMMTGSAHVSACAQCSGQKKVRFIGHGSSLTFVVHAPSAGSYTMAVYYTNAHVSRQAMISVNGGPAAHLGFAPTGDWYLVGILRTSVHLHAGKNTVKFSNPSDWVPDLDRITLSS